MEILLSFVLLVVGFVLLIKGADWFVEGAAGIAARFGIPQLVIGLTIVAMGTSAPEAAVSITSAIGGNAGITVGNVVGSNIMNILVILGVTAVIIAVPVQKSTVKIEIPFMIGITAVFLLLGVFDNELGRLDGVVMWALFIVYLMYLLRMALKNKESVEETQEQKPLWLQLLMLVGGAVIIVGGSNLTVDSATDIAKFFGVSDRFIGLTVIALGTSLPEFVTSVIAARKGNADIAIGNIVGSNIFNILFVAGTTALITPVVFQPEFMVDTIIAIASAVLLLVCVLPKKKLTRFGGVAMLVGYIGYFIYLLIK
ncbi:MAG: calcium/sodium antiporter [Lachnospiraceae bacterium]